MNTEKAIRVLKSTSVNLGRRGGRTAYVEALEMAITALDQLDNNSTKPDNSTATQFNGIESKVKGMTACRVPEVTKDTDVLNTDCISRQVAIDALDCINGVEEVLKALPSVQPDWDEMIVICDCCGHAIKVERKTDGCR